MRPALVAIVFAMSLPACDGVLAPGDAVRIVVGTDAAVDAGGGGPLSCSTTLATFCDSEYPPFPAPADWASAQSCGSWVGTVCPYLYSTPCAGLLAAAVNPTHICLFADDDAGALVAFASAGYGGDSTTAPIPPYCVGPATLGIPEDCLSLWADASAGVPCPPGGPTGPKYCPPP